MAETRVIVLQTRITTEEKERYEAAAKSCGVTLSEWVRGRLEEGSTPAITHKSPGLLVSPKRRAAVVGREVIPAPKVAEPEVSRPVPSERQPGGLTGRPIYRQGSAK